MSLNNIIKSIINATVVMPVIPTILPQFNRIIYVSPDGDDSDGSTWAKAYKTVQQGMSAAAADVNTYTAILIGAGVYTIAVAYTTVLHGRFACIGVDQDDCIINITCAGIGIDVVGIGVFMNLTFTGSFAASTMIRISYAFAKFIRCTFMALIDSTITAIITAGTNDKIEVENCIFRMHIGVTTDQYGINLANGSGNHKSIIRDSIFHNCAFGIQVIMNNSVLVERCHFTVYHGASNPTSAIYINSAQPSIIADCHFGKSLATDRAIYVADYTTVTISNCEFMSKYTQLYPLPNTLITLTTDGAAYTDGAEIVVIAAGAFVRPFRILGIFANAPSAPDTFFISVNNTTDFAVNIPATGTEMFIPFVSRIFTNVTDMEARASCIAGGAKTINVRFLIEVL